MRTVADGSTLLADVDVVDDVGTARIRGQRGSGVASNYQLGLDLLASAASAEIAVGDAGNSRGSSGALRAAAQDSMDQLPDYDADSSCLQVVACGSEASELSSVATLLISLPDRVSVQ